MSVTAPRGFRAAGVTAGLKSSAAPDLALVACDALASAAAVLTKNHVRAAPVRVTADAVADGRLRAVVANSGGANACTGAAGLADARAMAGAVARGLGCADRDVAVASTGLIGVPLPMHLVLPGIDDAVRALSPSGGAAAARAVMTTDTVPKESAHAFDTGRSAITVGGMAKGAGMLAPALATMLAVLTTDASVAPEHLDAVLRAATALTFDRLDSDGCMSTNDTVVLLASGAAGAELAPGLPGWADFAAAVHRTCADLVEQLAADAEGATKRICVEVRGAVDDGTALAGARGIARSALLKCALHGEDPNWGRVLAALGAATARFDPDRVGVAFNGVAVCSGGTAAGDPAAARAALAPRDIAVTVDLGEGPGSASILTTDLTAAYVHENSAYST